MSKKIVIYVNKYIKLHYDSYITKTYLIDKDTTIEIDTGIISDSNLPLLNITVEVENSFTLEKESAKNILRELVKNKI